MISKLPNITTSIFTVMSKMASDYNALNLSQGFPNFPIDPELKKILRNSADKECHQYAPMGGLPSLLNKILVGIPLQENFFANVMGASK